MAANFNRTLFGAVIAAAAIVCSTVGAAEIPWSTDIEASLHRAAANGQPVLLEFTADWCVFCKKMEKNTFPNPQVAQRISSNFVAVRVDADQNKDLVKDLGIKGLPAILIVSPDLKVIKRISGFQTPEALIKQLDEVTQMRPTQAGPPMIANSGAPQQRPMNQPVRQQPQFAPQQQPQFAPQQQQQPRFAPAQREQPNDFAPDAIAGTGPAPGELQFEAISQDEAPRAGAPRSRNPVAQNRPAPDPRKHQFFEAPDSENQQPSKPQLANNDAESFFKTISQEGTTRGSKETASAPAFGGLCVVSAVEDRELVNGASRYQISYRGHTLYFASVEKKEQFLASPGAFWPMLDGACAMTLLEDEKLVDGSLEFAAVFRKRIWLFSSQKAMDEFLSDPADVAEEAIELAAELQR
jgi:YHS domain-containing protein/thioredoxin-related protein